MTEQVRGQSEADPPRLGRPRDRRLDEAILTATVELLEHRGYNDLSLASVAERAGTTTPAIYRRWDSKAELVARAVFRTDGDDVVADTDDLEADLTTMIGWAAEKLCRPATLAAVVGLLGEPRSVRAARSAEAAMASQLTSERISRAQREGQVRDDVDPAVISAMIAGPVLSAVLAGEADRVDAEWVAVQVAVILRGIRP